MKKIITSFVVLFFMITLSMLYVNINIFSLLSVISLSICMLTLIDYWSIDNILEKNKSNKIIKVCEKIKKEYINKYSIILVSLVLLFFLSDIVNLSTISFFSKLNKDFWIKLVISVFIYLATVGFFEQKKVEKESKIQMAYSKVLNVRLLNMINYVLENSETDKEEIKYLENSILEIVEKFYEVNLNEAMEIIHLCKNFISKNRDNIEQDCQKLNKHAEKIKIDIGLSNLEESELNEMILKKNIETKFYTSNKNYANRLKVQDSLSRELMFEREVTNLLKKLYHNIISEYRISSESSSICLDSYVEDKNIVFEYKFNVNNRILYFDPKLLNLAKDGRKIVYIISGSQNVVNVRTLKKIEENELLVIDYLELSKLIDENKDKAKNIIENKVGYYGKDSYEILSSYKKNIS